MLAAGRAAACQALAAILDSVASAQFPPADGRVTILPQPSARDAGVFAFTAHSVIFADADPAWVAAQLPPGDLSAPLSPRFLQALAERIGREAHQTDLLACATALPGPPPGELTAEADPTHPRITRALRYRDDIRTWRVDGGVLLLGRGAGGRWEVAIEVDADHRGHGLGRRLATAARHLVPGGAPLWAQIAPGNAASVRTFLAAGFRPVGAESVLTPP
jgi:GNAT superfamily N-acetyltransferase